ncbi:hypothetical protein B9Z47_02685 [Limnohabitans sp. 2KL-1]|uniref:class I SAM-dependent methyltransferase n=1 Tax=Limnohabitans sp. 2KL-1 TaxID=1100699 RepID=UPI000D3AC14C|nr:class I SAM-dependent methyltransferase [Limnohabitans sp. 2KL-1]PUE50673.1 hypothetical protein B9Z47_02685 [Limnohabitans sp. 2KL-1]
MLKTPDIPRENLLELARSQFQLAQQHCDECCTYHAIWPYLRIAGAVGGVEADEPFLQPILEDLLQQGRTQILLAGSADSGVTALVHRVCVKLKHPARLTVLDRCMTPVMACQTYAQIHGLDLYGLHANLLSIDLSSKYDLIIGHSVLPFIPSDERRTLLAALAKKLNSNGRVLLTVRISSSQSNAINPHSQQRGPHEMASFVIDQLTSQSIHLPVSSASFHSLVHDYFQHRRHQVSQFTTQETLANDFDAVGLKVQALIPLGYGNSYNVGGQFTDVRSKGWAYVVCPA